MGRTTIKQDYFLWLYHQIGKRKKPSYMKLCKELHKTKFRWSVHNDDNRYEDGLNLRDAFIAEHNLDESHLEVRYFLKGECTVFEMLVALAKRIDEITYDLDTREDKTSRWFFEMIGNLRLDKFTDNSTRDDTFDPISEAQICDILEVFMDRGYDTSGTGSLFPLKRRHPEDMRRVEIWYQLMIYLDENYGQ